MADLVLFRIKKQAIAPLAIGYQSFLLFSFALFLIGGNFFRLFPVAPFPSYLSVVELALYLSAFPLYFSQLRKSHLLALCIAGSTFYGLILHGVDLASILYGLKLIGMIAAGVSVGEALFKKFGGEIECCLKYFVKIFLIILVLGIGIFIFFPKAHLFFEFLQGYGVNFTGDPHQRRFISPFFDPNYYSAIACIPLILTWFLGRKGSVYYSILFFFFLGSILLSFSRSGITTCLVLLFFVAISQLFYLRVLQLTTFTLGIFFAFAVVGLMVLYSEEFLYFLDRLFHVDKDASAYARLISFKKGSYFFWQHPYFGTGYNYLAKLLHQEGAVLTIDSSLLLTLVNFGLIPTLLFAIWCFYWSVRSLKKGLHPVFYWLYIYVALCILFTSQFNNLLYYQYWLIPIISLFTYFNRSLGESCSST